MPLAASESDALSPAEVDAPFSVCEGSNNSARRLTEQIEFFETHSILSANPYSASGYKKRRIDPIVQDSLDYRVQTFLRHQGNLLPDGSMLETQVANVFGVLNDAIIDVVDRNPTRFACCFPENKEQARVRAMGKHSKHCNLSHPMWGDPLPDEASWCF